MLLRIKPRAHTAYFKCFCKIVSSTAMSWGLSQAENLSRTRKSIRRSFADEVFFMKNLFEKTNIHSHEIGTLRR